MKPIYIQTAAAGGESFSVSEHVGKYFEYPYHFHPEYELTLILKGKGTRLVGNSIQSFDKDDLVLVGQNLPHHWHSDPGYYSNDSRLSVKAVVVKFPNDFEGIKLFDLPENYNILQLLNKASKGIKIVGKTQVKVARLITSLLRVKDTQRIIVLLSVLSEIAASSEVEVLSNAEGNHLIKSSEMDRMNKVYEYILNNYLNHISLTEAASVANMNTAAFCKYFKKRYRKTFITTVNEIKIKHACRLLRNEDINVSEVCYNSGFNNLSNFTRTFKIITGYNPKEYQKRALLKQ